jgi:hypothetical protein
VILEKPKDNLVGTFSRNHFEIDQLRLSVLQELRRVPDNNLR